jgi:peptidoglycan/LPS O-acetylase OafA/YrhL
VVATAVSRLPDGGRFVALDSWRGIAALAVVAYHVQVRGLGFSSTIVSNAWAAVDFFFVLSGFVISAAYGSRLSDGFSLARFMTLRLGRVYPLHLLVLALYVAAELAKLPLRQAGLDFAAPFSTRSDLSDLALTALLMQVFVVPTPLHWSPASWSIAVEVWLYLAAAAAWRLLGARAWIAAVFVSLGALIVVGSPGQDWLPSINRDLLRGLAGFGMGMVCWHVWNRGLEKAWRQAPAAAALGMEVLAVGLVLAALALSMPLPVIDFAFAFLVLAFAADRGALSRLLARAPFVWIGVLSYSIYLVHLLVLLSVRTLLRAVAPAPDPLLSMLAVFAVFALTIAVAYVTWRLVESPARNWSRRRAAAMGAGPEERAAPTI